MITALGVGLFLENFTLGLLGPEPQRFPSLIAMTPWQVAGLTITPLQVLIILLAAALMIALDLLVRRTLLGMAMRAISYNRPIVPLMGVPVDRVISLTFAIGSAIAAAGGLMYGLAYPVLDPYMGIRIGWWAFIPAVVGGIGNIRGAMLGGFILGTVEVFTPLILPASWAARYLRECKRFAPADCGLSHENLRPGFKANFRKLLDAGISWRNRGRG